MVNATMQEQEVADKEYWIVSTSSLSASSLSRLRRNLKALHITHPIYQMQEYATKVRDQARLKNLRKKREKASIQLQKSSFSKKKRLGFLTSAAEDGVEGATGGFGG